MAVLFQVRLDFRFLHDNLQNTPGAGGATRVRGDADGDGLGNQLCQGQVVLINGIFGMRCARHGPAKLDQAIVVEVVPLALLGLLVELLVGQFGHQAHAGQDVFCNVGRDIVSEDADGLAGSGYALLTLFADFFHFNFDVSHFVIP